MTTSLVLQGGISIQLPIALSNRHVHLCQKDLDALFGEGYQLTVKKPLSQPGQYASQETVDLVGPKGELKKVRILGPVRSNSQAELSFADARSLGVTAPVRESGDIKDSAQATVRGPKGQIELRQGVIIAARHIHMSPLDAEKFGVKDGEMVDIKCQGERAVTFHNVRVRVSPGYALEMHVDIEEGNAAGLQDQDQATLIKVSHA